MSLPHIPPMHRSSSTVRFAREGLPPLDTTQSDSSVLGDAAFQHRPSEAVDEQELFRGGEGMAMEQTRTDPGAYGALPAHDPSGPASHSPAAPAPSGTMPSGQQGHSGYTANAQPMLQGYAQPVQQISESPAVMSMQGSEYYDPNGHAYPQRAAEQAPRPSAMYGGSPFAGQAVQATQGVSPVSTLVNQYAQAPSPLSLGHNAAPGAMPLGNPSAAVYAQQYDASGYPIQHQIAPQVYRQYASPQAAWTQSQAQMGMPPSQQGWNTAYLYAQQPPTNPHREFDLTLAGEDIGEVKKYDDAPVPPSDKYTSARKPQFGSGGRDGNRALAQSDGSDTEMRRRGTREMEKAEKAYVREEPYVVKGGVFSQLLRLTGRSATLRKRQSKAGGHGMDSRASSMTGGDGGVPTLKSLGLQRVGSTATTFGGDAEELDDLDPRVTGQKKKVINRRQSFSDLVFRRNGDEDADGIGGRKYRRRASVQYHVADILTRQQFILKLAKALMTFGAPSHRIESQLAATALVLEVDAQFLHLPSIVLASFGDIDTRTSEMHFVKAGGALDLGKLHRVHSIYKAVVHDEYDAAEGAKNINALLKSDRIYNVWVRIGMAFFSSGLVCPMAFGGSFVDGLASGSLGVLLAFLQLQVASKNAMYSNIFEISIATFISFAARGLSVTGIFCYQSIVSAGVTLILPGYTILCGSLELASKNIVAGSVRMVYAIIYSLFLGFGITIGSDLFYVVDQPARRAANAASAAAASYLTISGTFTPGQVLMNNVPGHMDATNFLPFNGTFTFSNATTDPTSSALRSGSIICPRPPGLPWWRQGMPRPYLIAVVPIFSVLIATWNFQPLKSRQLPVMVVISCIGYATNQLANRYIFDRSDVVTAIGAFVIGVLGNVYSRVFGGTAFTSMVPGVLFLTPSGIAAAGGLAMTAGESHSDSYNQGLIIGFRMVQVAIGITVGLFGSGLLIYSFGRKKGSALFAF